MDKYAIKYENALKDKMLMKLEKDRLKAKVENLEFNLIQMEEEARQQDSNIDLHGQSKAGMSQSKMGGATTGMSQGQQKPSVKTVGGILKMTNEPHQIPKRERFNPALNETFEASGPHLQNLKTYKGHLQSITALAYNPKKDIVATASDDTTWKLWSVPAGDLIMSGEGH